MIDPFRLMNIFKAYGSANLTGPFAASASIAKPGVVDSENENLLNISMGFVSREVSV